MRYGEVLAVRWDTARFWPISIHSCIPIQPSSYHILRPCKKLGVMLPTTFSLTRCSKSTDENSTLLLFVPRGFLRTEVSYENILWVKLYHYLHSTLVQLCNSSTPKLPVIMLRTQPYATKLLPSPYSASPRHSLIQNRCLPTIGTAGFGVASSL